MTKNATHEFVVGRVFLKDESRRQVAKLMWRYPDADLFGNAVDDLVAQRGFGLMAIRLAWEEPVARSGNKTRSEYRKVCTEHLVHYLGHGIFEWLVILNFLRRDDEVIGRFSSAHANDVLFQVQRGQVFYWLHVIGYNFPITGVYAYHYLDTELRCTYASTSCFLILTAAPKR